VVFLSCFIAEGDARELYDQLRALKGRASAARLAAGKPFSQREIEKALRRPPFSVEFRGKTISEWLPDDFPRAKVPHADGVWPLIRLWCDWAGEPEPDERSWQDLVERAQPVRRPPSDRKPVGRPIADYAGRLVLDYLEVHPCIEVGQGTGLDLLPPYVKRKHDAELRAVVEAAMTGTSRIAVLVGGSSTGKTRACWEALEPLREQGGWRLWHPFDPSRTESALEALDHVGPRTVVWLALRAATAAPLDKAQDVGLLLKVLPPGELVGRLLAREPAAHVSISYTGNHIRSDVMFLEEQLRAVGAEAQADYLLRRLVAAGRFSDAYRRGPYDDGILDEFRWGREPDGAPAEPWGWDDVKSAASSA